MTKVISFYAGPGAGKSTTAAQLFAAMKEKGYKVELVQEFVKSWAWEGKPVGPLDQFYIMAKQMRAESRLYGKVDYIITDSPLYLAAYYDQKINNSQVLRTTIEEFIDRAGVERIDVLLKRDKPYYNHGRYHTEAEALEADDEILGLYLSVSGNFLSIKTGQVGDLMGKLNL